MPGTEASANKGDGWLLFHIWIQRFAYRQLFSVVLFKTVKRAIDGKPFNWDKLERTAKMSDRRAADGRRLASRLRNRYARIECESLHLYAIPRASALSARIERYANRKISTVIQPVAPRGAFVNEPFIDFTPENCCDAGRADPGGRQARATSMTSSSAASGAPRIRSSR